MAEQCDQRCFSTVTTYDRRILHKKRLKRKNSRTIIHASIRPESSSSIRTNTNSKGRCKSKIMPIDKEMSFNSTQWNSSSREMDVLSTEKLSFGELRDIEERSKKRRKAKKFYCAQCPWSYICLGSIILGLLLTILLLQFLPKSTTTTTTINSMTTATTTTMTIITTTTITTTTTTTTTSTTTIITTTTTVACASSCDTQTWLDSTNLCAQWQFDNNSIEAVANTNTPTDQSPTYVTGYIKTALLFGLHANQSLTSASISLPSSSSFTFDAWIYPTGFPNSQDHSIFGLCPAPTTYECLYFTIRFDSGIYILYFGFYGTEYPGSTPISLNEWIHVAFVFDTTSLTQSIYLNGKLDASQTASGPFKGNAASITIGNIAAIETFSGPNYFQGIIDRVQISDRAKLSCEILEEATLSAYFSFNTGKELIDSGPNALSAVAQSISYISTGHSQQAISLNKSSSSYYQIAGVTSIGISNRPFSFSLWVRPRSLSGILIHVSATAAGGGWCVPFMGFSANGSIVAQMFKGGVYSVTGPLIPLYPFWTHIVQTWSSASGLRLYINSALVASSTSMSGLYTASSQQNYVTLGSAVTSSGACAPGGLGSMDSFTGDIDEFRIYSREIFAADICALYLR